MKNWFKVFLIFFNREKDLVDLKNFAYRLLNVETDPQSLMRLGVLMARNSFPDFAMDCFTKVMRLYPDYSGAYLATGTLFANLGKYAQAVHIWKIGSSIEPSDVRFRENINKAQSVRNRVN